MPFDFPNSPTDGDVYAPPGGPVWHYSGGAWRQNSTAPITDVVITGVILPEWYGAKGDGVTDDTLAIQDAIDAAGATPGGKVQLGCKTYKITATLDVPFSNVSIIGAGSDVHHSLFPQGAIPSTKLLWGGANGGTMLHVHSPEGAGNQQQVGGGVTGVYFKSGVVNGNDGAGIGLRISSRHKGFYRDLYFSELRDVGLQLDCVTTLGEDRGCANNTFVNIAGSNSYQNMDGGFIRLWGDAAAGGSGNLSNVYFNQFFNCRPVFNTGGCYDFGNSDHNRFYGCSANALKHTYTVTPVDATISLANPCVITATAHGMITGHAVQFVSNGDTLPAALTFAFPYYVTKIDNDTFNISTTLANRIAGVFIDTSGGSQLGAHKLLGYGGKGIRFRASTVAGCNARENRFYDFSGGDVIQCDGTEAGMTVPSANNNFTGLDHTNYTPYPTLGTGATSWVSGRDDGSQPQGKFIKSAFAGASLLTGINSLLMDKTQARMTNEAMRIANSASDHIRLEVPNGDYSSVLTEWSIGVMNSGGDLRFNRSVGSSGVINSLMGIRVSTSSTGQGLGYGVGSGGSATQLTSKATSVGLNRSCGLLTTAADALAANTAVTFQFTNNNVEANDVIILNHDTAIGGTAGAYTLNIRTVAGGGFVTIRNVTAGSLSEAIGIRFAIIKAVIT
jgi:hypothetical protein